MLTLLGGILSAFTLAGAGWLGFRVGRVAGASLESYLALLQAELDLVEERMLLLGLLEPADADEPEPTA